MDYAIVDSINRISHVLGMRTVAESVEDAVTLEKIKALNIDFVQGYFIAKPEALISEASGGGRLHPGAAQVLQTAQPTMAAAPPRASSFGR
jgi:Amt family ammonium transporter